MSAAVNVRIRLLDPTATLPARLTVTSYTRDANGPSVAVVPLPGRVANTMTNEAAIQKVYGDRVEAIEQTAVKPRGRKAADVFYRVTLRDARPAVPIYHAGDVEVNPDENDPADRWVSVYLHDPAAELDESGDTVQASLTLTADEARTLARALDAAADGKPGPDDAHENPILAWFKLATRAEMEQTAARYVLTHWAATITAAPGCEKATPVEVEQARMALTTKAGWAL